MLCESGIWEGLARRMIMQTEEELVRDLYSILESYIREKYFKVKFRT